MREQGWGTAWQQAAKSGEVPGDSEHVIGGHSGGRWWDEWLRCESVSLMEASTSTRLSSWSMWLAHPQPVVRQRASSLWAWCFKIPLWICAENKISSYLFQYIWLSSKSSCVCSRCLKNWWGVNNTTKAAIGNICPGGMVYSVLTQS